MTSEAAERRVTRLTVNIGPKTAEALQYLMDREGVTLTEALRRLVELGYILHREGKHKGRDILLRKGSKTKIVTFL